MTTLTAEQLGCKFIGSWPETNGDLYQDNQTGTSFVVGKGDDIERKLKECRKRFNLSPTGKVAGE